MFLYLSRIRSCTRKIAVIGLMIVLSANSLLAAPEAATALYVSVGEINRNLSHTLASTTTGLGNFFSFSMDSFRALLTRLGRKQTTVDRIVILPSDEKGELSVMQGDKVVFTAIGYSGEDAIGGVPFILTAQDEAGARAERTLLAGVFDATRPGRYLVSAKADNGQQAQIIIAVIRNEGYVTQRLIQKKESERTEEENQTIAEMVRTGKLTSRQTSSKGSHNAETERALYEDDQRRLEEVRRQQEINREKDPVPKQNSEDVNPTPQVSEAAPTSHKRGGPNADDLIESNVAPSKKARKPMMMRAAGLDGWDGTNWYTADDPGNAVGHPENEAPDAGAGTGDFQFSAPILSLAGRGIDVNLNLFYNSRLWSKYGTAMTYDSDKGWPAPGWNLGFGKMMYMGGTGGCMLVTPDGTRRSYNPTNTIYSGGSSYTSFTDAYTTDGSFIDYSCYYASNTYGTALSGSARLPNGTTITYSSPDTAYGQVYPTQIMDAQGNYITITYVSSHGPNISTITDTLGRTITFNYESSSPYRLISISGLGIGSTTTTYARLHYTGLSLGTGLFASGYTTDTVTSTPDVIDSIYYPTTNTGYWFGDTGSSASYSTYGMLAKVIQQRGMASTGTSTSQGSVTSGTMTDQQVYDFPLTAVSTLTDAPLYTTMTETWDSMDTSAAVTTYNIATSGSDQIITVTQPDLTVNKQTSVASDGVYYQGEIYASSSAGTPLSKTKMFFESGDYGSTRVNRIERTDELNHTTATDLVYASSAHNQLITQKEYSYGGTTLYRQTNNTYTNYSGYINRHIFNLLKSTQVVNASSVPLTLTEYQYDNNAEVSGTGSPNLMNTSGVVMHNYLSDPYTAVTQDGSPCISGHYEWESNEDGHPIHVFYCDTWTQVSAYDPNTLFRGNVTKTTVYSDAATPSGGIAYDYTYDETGNQRTATTNCCQQIGTTYSSTTQFSQPDSVTKGSSSTSSALRMTQSATYDFNTGVVLTSTDFNGIATTYSTYDAALRPTLVTLHTGATTAISYDDANLASTSTSKLSDGATIVSKTTTQLNGRGQTVLSKYQAGSTNWNAQSIQYDVMGRKWKEFMPYDAASTPSYWTTYAYDGLSRPTQITAPDGSTSKNFYNESGSRPDSATTSTSGPGQTIRSQDAWGRERWTRTDDFGRLAEVVEPNPALPSSPSVNVASSANGATATASSTYSGYSPSSANNGDRNVLTGSDWVDATAGTFPDWLQVDFSGSKTISEIDLFSLPDSYWLGTPVTEATTFSAYGLTNFDLQYWTGSAWTTIPGGSITGNNKAWFKLNFPAVTTTKIRLVVNSALFSYSGVVELEAWTHPDHTGSVSESSSLKTSYAYDQLDQLTTITQDNQTRSFKYDSLGRLTRQKLAEQTATINDAGCYVSASTGCSGPANWSEAFTYDARSNVTQRTDARGVKTNFDYTISSAPDPLNRLQGISYNTSTADTTYTINSAPSVTLEYMTTGDQTRVKKVTTASTVTEENAFDSEGRISQYKMTFDSRTLSPFTTDYTYDTANRLTQVTYPEQYGMSGCSSGCGPSGYSRHAVAPSYDQASRLTQLNVDSASYLSSVSYNAASQVTQLTAGAATAYSRKENYGYDALTGLLTSQSVTNAGATATYMDVSYSYDRGGSSGSLSGKTGQMTKVTDNLDHNRDKVYEFDGIGRLAKAKGGTAAGAASVTANWTQSYSYDRYGNKTGVTASGITQDTNSVPADGLPSVTTSTSTNRITTSGWLYDLAGNLTRGQDASGTWQRFEYDAAGRLKKIFDDSSNLLENYTYGATRERLINEYSSGRTYYAWGGESVVAEYTEATSSTTPAYSKAYIYAGSRLLVTMDKTSTTTESKSLDHPNRLGTGLVTTGSSTYFTQSTLPFGTALNAESGAYTNQVFTSYDHSNNTGLDYAVNRTYSKGQSRFTQVDPLRMGAAIIGDPQSNNLFSYSQNMPTDFTDPSGLFMLGPDPKLSADELCFLFGYCSGHAPLGLPDAIPLEGLLDFVSGVIEKAKGDCAKLLGPDAFDKYNKLRKEGKIKYDPTGLKATTGAKTDGDNIQLNPYSFTFDPTYTLAQIPGLDVSNKNAKENTKAFGKAYKDSKASSRYEYAAAAVIHEFLHAINRLGPDVSEDIFGGTNVSESKKNQNRVVEACFSSKK